MSNDRKDKTTPIRLAFRLTLMSFNVVHPELVDIRSKLSSSRFHRHTTLRATTSRHDVHLYRRPEACKAYWGWFCGVQGSNRLTLLLVSDYSTFLCLSLCPLFLSVPISRQVCLETGSPTLNNSNSKTRCGGAAVVVTRGDPVCPERLAVVMWWLRLTKQRSVR